MHSNRHNTQRHKLLKRACQVGVIAGIKASPRKSQPLKNPRRGPVAQVFEEGEDMRKRYKQEATGHLRGFFSGWDFLGEALMPAITPT